MSVPDPPLRREPPTDDTLKGAAADLYGWWRHFFFPAIVFMLLAALFVNGCWTWDRLREHENRLDAVGAPETWELP